MIVTSYISFELEILKRLFQGQPGEKQADIHYNHNRMNSTG